ncbi:MAG: M14 family metallopeptidase [Bacteroidota bacterium]
MKVIRVILISLCSLIVAQNGIVQNSIAQDAGEARFTFSPEITYKDAIPSPASFLGYKLGDYFTLHAHALDYFEALAAASGNVTLHEYGRSYEGRKLVYAVITSAENHAKIDEIKAANQQLANGEASQLMENQPLIHWMSYNVHGNEPSSTETAMQIAYRLAAGTDAKTQQMLDDLVVIIDPCLNPDGRDRYVYWYKSMHSKHLNTSADDLEHNEPWPGGRTNHYWFDLNRDWVWLIHPESQGRIKAYQEWLPQVHIDYHEQGFNNNYFTHPGTTPRNLNLPPAHFDWEAKFGRGDATAFDKEGISYFTNEAFDFYYPGYGSSYPSLMGGIGMLREQGGHSRGGRAVKVNDDYILTLRQRVYDHYLTSVAGMETSLDNKAALMRYFQDAMNPSKSNKRPEKRYFIEDDKNSYARDLVHILLEHGVEVSRVDEQFTAPAVYDYWSQQPTRRTFEAGTFVVDTDQPRHLFVNTLLQKQMAIEDSIMYDMATWSAPIAYNLKAGWVTSVRGVQVNASPITTVPQTTGMVENAGAGYAYIIDWAQRNAPTALAGLWKAGYAVRSIKKPMEIGEQKFGRGSLVVLVGRNRTKLSSMAADMQRIAREAGVSIYGYDSGWTEGSINPASRESLPVKNPTVGLVMDTPFNSYTAGQLWFLFEEWTNLPINRIRLSQLASLELKKYDVLILPGARGNLSSQMDSSTVAALRGWVKAGGTLVGTENSAIFLSKSGAGMADVSLYKKEKKKEEDDKPAFEAGSLEDPYVGLEARKDLRDLDNIPGSALRSYLDTTHPLAYGMPRTLFSLKFGNQGFEPTTKAQVVGYYHTKSDSVLASGYMSVKNREELAGKAFAIVAPQGRGKVVMLLDNTQYRMFWVGTARLMQNAVMLVPSL